MARRFLRCRLQAAGIAPLALGPKEGLALINGTQTSTALALHALLAFEPVLEAALVIGALTIDAARGSDGPFDPRIHAAARPAAARWMWHRYYRALLVGQRDPQLAPSMATTGCRTPTVAALPAAGGWRLPGPAAPRRAGAADRGQCRDRQPAGVCAKTRPCSRAATSTPSPVALAADGRMALAIAEVGAIAERRIAMLIDSSVSRLPPFLTDDAGLNSGFMIAHVTAASLASENKSLAHPASVDSLPTSANQEDHVSMATFAARRLRAMVDNARRAHPGNRVAGGRPRVLIFCGLCRVPRFWSRCTPLLRRNVAKMMQDRYLAPDIAHATVLVQDGSLARMLQSLAGLPAAVDPRLRPGLTPEAETVYFVRGHATDTSCAPPGSGPSPIPITCFTLTGEAHEQTASTENPFGCIVGIGSGAQRTGARRFGPHQSLRRI
jgi:histidine ammonia-lyase